MHHNDPDHTHEVFRSGILSVQHCGCGLVHLAVGPVTIKLTRDAFDQVVSGVQRASERLREVQAPAAPPEPPASRGASSGIPLLNLLKGGIH